MGRIELDDSVYEQVRFAARLFGVSETEVVARAIKHLAQSDVAATRPAKDPWEPVDVYTTYAGERVEGQYLPATKRLTVTSGPLAGKAFKSPSGAARAVIESIKPQRESTQTNGWRFWRLTDTDERLGVLR